MIIRHCAPTLAGLKTGNIFTTSYHSRRTLNQDLQRLSAVLNKKGLRVICLRASKGRALIYLFRPGRLQQDLSREEARTILKENGYEHTPHEFCIRRLIDRICHSQDFPHEIGLFLGYPPEDVRGFIDCRGKGCKSCGYWKV